MLVYKSLMVKESRRGTPPGYMEGTMKKVLLDSGGNGHMKSVAENMDINIVLGDAGGHGGGHILAT